MFRLGSKTSKNPTVAEELKRKKAVKERKILGESAAKTRATSKKPAAIEPRARVSDPLAIVADEIIEADPVDDSAEGPLQEEVLSVEEASLPASDYESVEELVAEMRAAESDDAILVAIPVEADPTDDLDSDTLMQHASQEPAPTPLAPAGKHLPTRSPLANSAWESKSKRQAIGSSSTNWDTLAAPILTLVLACIVIPVATSYAWEMGRAFNGYVSVSQNSALRGDIIYNLLTSGLVSLLFWGLAVSMTTWFLVTIVELTSKEQIVLPSKISAILAAVLLVALALLFVGKMIDIIRMARLTAALGAPLDGQERPGMTWQFLAIFVLFCQYTIVPMAVIALSFCRKFNR